MTAARTLTDSDMIVTLTRGELREIVTAAVREALEAKADDWIGPDEVAAMLGVARSTVPVCGIERAAGIVIAVKRIETGSVLYRVHFDDASTPDWYMTAHETRREVDR